MFLRSLVKDVIVNSDAVSAIEIHDRGPECAPGVIKEQYPRYQVIARFGFQAGAVLYETSSEEGAEAYLDHLCNRLNEGLNIASGPDEDEEYDDSYQGWI